MNNLTPFQGGHRPLPDRDARTGRQVLTQAAIQRRILHALLDRPMTANELMFLAIGYGVARERRDDALEALLKRGFLRFAMTKVRSVRDPVRLFSLAVPKHKAQQWLAAAEEGARA